MMSVSEVLYEEFRERCANHRTVPLEQPPFEEFWAAGECHLPIGSDGLIVADYFQGNRTPHTDPLVRGMIWGLSAAPLAFHAAAPSSTRRKTSDWALAWNVLNVRGRPEVVASPAAVTSCGSCPLLPTTNHQPPTTNH